MPFWARRFCKAAFLFYLALFICIFLKQPDVGEKLFYHGYEKFSRHMTSSQYFLSVLPSVTLIHSWTPVRPPDQDYVVNGPSWTVMALIWVWFLYPCAAALLMRLPDSRVHIFVGACVVACFLPFTFLQPWAHPPQLVAGTNPKATAFNLLYEWPPFIAPRFLAGVAAAEAYRRRDMSLPRRAAAWYEPMLADVFVVAACAIAAFTPYSGDMQPACKLRQGSLSGPCLLWQPEDPGFGHRAPRLGFEILFDVALLPLWLLVFYYGGLESESGYTGPILWLCRTPVMSHLGKWVWGMYIFREPVHIAILLLVPAKMRCGMEGLMRCMAVDAHGHPRILYTAFSDLQPLVWVMYVVALVTVSAVLTEFVDTHVSAAMIKLAPDMPAPVQDKSRPALPQRGAAQTFPSDNGTIGERTRLLGGVSGGMGLTGAEEKNKNGEGRQDRLSSDRQDRYRQVSV
eukprot:Tamp_13440.p1 GENE.Tamp_13440~~Tamp_13440.p1  ORF type:complete len:520 (-),score=49.10 Tamp_13440:162-1529(-)